MGSEMCIRDRGSIDGVTDADGVIRGIDGQTFKILLNKRAFGHGDIITYDKYNGKELYVTCIACHGPSGMGNPTLNSPKLAGLPDWYIANQLWGFKRGHRGENPKDIYGNS